MANDSQLDAKLAAVDTPCLILDEARLDRNIARMNAIARRQGVQLRPHVKTAKCHKIARKIFGGVGPITVSTLKEAEYFLADGFVDILYAVSISPAKLARAHELAKAGAKLTVLVDGIEAAEAVTGFDPAAPTALDVAIEIDSDGQRAGLKPNDPLIATIAETICQAPNVGFFGVMTHAGGSYGCTETDGIRRHAEQERAAVVEAAGHIRRRGLPCPNVSVGSTPTLTFASNLSGVTEARAGVYVFQDLVQSNLGVCALDDIAISVMATVISHKPDTGWIIVDAGGLALSKDRGTASQANDYGYGAVCDAQGRLINGLRLASVSQEHGLIVADDEEVAARMFATLPVGTRVRILPNHACMTAAAYDTYHVVNDNRLELWARCNGW